MTFVNMFSLLLPCQRGDVIDALAYLELTKGLYIVGLRLRLIDSLMTVVIRLMMMMMILNCSMHLSITCPVGHAVRNCATIEKSIALKHK